MIKPKANMLEGLVVKFVLHQKIVKSNIFSSKSDTDDKVMITLLSSNQWTSTMDNHDIINVKDLNDFCTLLQMPCRK